MIIGNCQISNPNDFSGWNSAEEIECSRSILDWIAGNPLFNSKVYENTLELGKNKFYRFSVVATDVEGKVYHGYGRSKDRLKAASIAVGEVIERYVAKKILKSKETLTACNTVMVKDAEISVLQSEVNQELPTDGFHSSNGWGVHYSLRSAIENSVLEAMERHILLYTYLQCGWDGFQCDNKIEFKNQTLTPYISKYSFGGFGAGIVSTEGPEFPGQTFGYLCDSAEKINTSSKWLSAFFESYGQWEVFVKNPSQVLEDNWLTKYQHYFLNNRHEVPSLSTKPSSNYEKVISNILMLDLQKLLNLPVPFFAAYTYGGDLIPLFFKQKLSLDEQSSVRFILKKWHLPVELPEYHPIL